jgi:hypothetical protein
MTLDGDNQKEDFNSQFAQPTRLDNTYLINDEPPKYTESKNGQYLSLYKRLYNILFKPPLGGHILNFYREKIDITVFFGIPFIILYLVCICIDFLQFIVFLSFTIAVGIVILLIIIKFFGLVEVVQQLVNLPLN